MEEISKIIVAKRKALGLSMEKVARKADVTLKTVINMEKGFGVSASTLFAVLHALDLEFIIKDKDGDNA